MKNCMKHFPVESWLDNSFITAEQLTTCRALLLENGTQLALCVIDQQALGEDLRREGQALSKVFLDPTEQSRLEYFAFAKRQREWLSGRIAAKKAAMQLLPKNPNQNNAYLTLRVENDPVGRPYLLSQINQEPALLAHNHHTSLPEISITHSGGVAAALAVEHHPCGLDVQKITAKAINVRERFASPAEQTLLKNAPALQNSGEAEAFTLLWAAKESLRKSTPCQPLLGFKDVHLCQVEGTPHGGMIARCTSPRLKSGFLPPVFLALSKGYACAITVNLL